MDDLKWDSNINILVVLASRSNSSYPSVVLVYDTLTADLIGLYDSGGTVFEADSDPTGKYLACSGTFGLKIFDLR
jgi:hypothetical protein